jgi:hypothetical protein
MAILCVITLHRLQPLLTRLLVVLICIRAAANKAAILRAGALPALMALTLSPNGGVRGAASRAVERLQ